MLENKLIEYVIQFNGKNVLHWLQIKIFLKEKLLIEKIKKIKILINFLKKKKLIKLFL